MCVVKVEEWSRRHDRQVRRWVNETNLQLRAFMLRAEHEPYSIKPNNLAVLADGALAGRFSYRLVNGSAFVGVYLQPEARNKGIALDACGLSLRKVAMVGAKEVWCSVAAPNRAAFWLNAALGYKCTGESDWRVFPDGFSLPMLLKWHTDHWRFLPEPAVLYRRMSLSLSGWGNS